MNTIVSRDGTTIAFDRSGHGPAVILVNGALSTRSAGAPLSARLSSRFTVFAYDRRGRIDSGDTPPYAVGREIEDLDAMIADAGGSAFVYGHSSGAILALEAARALPARIMKLALYEPPFVVDDSRPAVPSDYLSQIAELLSAGRRGEAVEYFMTAVVGTPADVVIQMRQAPMWPALERLAHTLPYDLTIVGDTLNGSRLPLVQWSALTLPVLVMERRS